VRIAVLGLRVEADLLERLGDPLSPLLVAHARTLDQQAFLDDLADGEPWGE
jgi:hypothetical protein